MTKVALVLAAGGSIRMGRPKLALPVGGKSMSRRSVETLLSAPFDVVRVVAAQGATLDLPPDPRVEVVENPEADEGIASSIRRGLEALPRGTALVAVALADLPLMRPETLEALFRAHEGNEDAIVYPEYRGRRGHPVFWPEALLDELRALSGDEGARSVLDRHRELALAVPVDDPGVYLDIDTPEDYATLKSFLEAEGGS